MLGLGELRAVVGRRVVLDCVADLLRGDVEMQSHRHCCQHVVDVVAADEVGCDFMPVAPILAPFQSQERVTGDKLTVNARTLLALVAGVTLGLDALGQDAHQVLVVGVDKDDAVLAGCQVVIEFALGADYALQRAKA